MTDKTFAQLRVEAESLGIITPDNARQGKEELKNAIASHPVTQMEVLKEAFKDTGSSRGGER